MSNGSTTWNMTYNADGLQTKRTNGSTTYSYIYNGSSLSQMTVGSNTLRFAYDASGTPMSVTYNGTNYYYVTNIQGDITALLNTSGTAVVQYTYDAWGNILTTTGSMASTLGETNPLRYRGYVYDRETSLYYINSRYYAPSVSRFVSADVLISTGQGLLGNDMYAYCRNNPVCRIDITGYADEEADLDGETKDDLFPDPMGGDGNGQPVVGNGNGSSSNPYIGGTYSPGQYYPNNPTTNPQYQPPSGGGGVTSSTNVNGVQVDFSHGGRHIDPNAYNFMDLQEVIAHDAVQQAGYHSSGGYVQIMYDGYPVNYSFFLRDSNHINIGTYYFAVDIR